MTQLELVKGCSRSSAQVPDLDPDTMDKDGPDTAEILCQSLEQKAGRQVGNRSCELNREFSRSSSQ